jgi:hypothetical protein
MSTAETSTAPGSVYARLIELSPEYQPSGHWRRFARPLPFYCVTEQPDALLAMLLAEFSVETLDHAGVVDVAAGGPPRLVASLSQPGTILLPLYDAASAPPDDSLPAGIPPDDVPPDDILVDGGCLSGRLPASAAMQDPRFRRALAADPAVLYLAFSMVDAAALWSLGLPATLASGLQRIRGRQLADFCRQFRIPRYAPDHSTPRRASAAPAGRRQNPAAGERLFEPPPHLTLVGWSPQALDAAEPELFDGLHKHWDDCRRHLDIGLEEVYVWRTTPDELTGFEFAAEHGTGRDLRRLIAASSERSAASFGWSPPAESLPPADIGAAVERLITSSRSRDPAAMGRVEAEYTQMLARDVLQPLIDLAAEVECPLTGSALVLAAEMGRLVHQLAARIACRGIRIVDGRPDPHLQQLLSLIDRYLKIFNGIQTWDRSHNGRLLGCVRYHRLTRPSTS